MNKTETEELELIAPLCVVDHHRPQLADIGDVSLAAPAILGCNNVRAVRWPRQKIAQFKRALAHVFDALSKERISEALRELESKSLNVSTPSHSVRKQQQLWIFQAVRISKALSTFAIPEIREIVQEIESVLKPDNET